MKFLYYLIFFLFWQYCNSQEKITGLYENDLGEKLILNPDHTFEYTWNFDLAASWNIGTWKIKDKKLIHLTLNEIKDTLRSGNKVELVLSSDKISSKISDFDYALTLISGGGQSRKLPPKKLFLQKNKLYTFSESGKIQKRKLTSMLNPKVKSKPWFQK